MNSQTEALDFDPGELLVPGRERGGMAGIELGRRS